MYITSGCSNPQAASFSPRPSPVQGATWLPGPPPCGTSPGPWKHGPGYSEENHRKTIDNGGLIVVE